MRHDLPPTLPAWLLVFLAVQGDWVSRERLLALLWPDAVTAEAQHKLRTSLLRARQLLRTWGCESALAAERRRVRLVLPSDVGLLRAALARQTPPPQDVDEALALHERPFMAGLDVPGFPALQDWAEQERAELQARWRHALLQSINAPGAAPDSVLSGAQRLLDIDPLDDAAMSRLLVGLRALGRDAEAARRFATFESRLHSELGVSPAPALLALAAQLPVDPRADEQRPMASRDAFVGRTVELQQLQAIVAQGSTRLLTLLAPGGVGKSRLARDLYLHLAAGPLQPVWVPMADLGDARDLWHRLCQVLDLVDTGQGSGRARALAVLAQRQGLVVLDNAEHLDGFDHVMADLLEGTPAALRWLVTSQVPVGVPGERIFALEGLGHPASGESVRDVDEARRFDALRLLEARALAVQPRFDLAQQLAPCVTLVQRLAGWPLAIEMVALALAAQPARAVLADLDRSLDTLAAAEPPGRSRHLSIRASLELSWDTLSPTLQTALARMSVLCGRFERAQALQITRIEGSDFAALVARLLVPVSERGRFELHPLMARFAAEKLARMPGEPAGTRGRHAEHFMGLLAQFSDRRFSPWSKAAQAMLDDFENFRAAWLWQLDHAPSEAWAPAARAWSMFANLKGRVDQTLPLVEQALARASALPAVRAPLLLALSNLHYRAGRLDDAAAIGRQAVAAAREAGGAEQLRAALNSAALPLIQLGDLTQALACVSEALDSARRDGAETEVATLSNTAAMIAKSRGDWARAASLYTDAIALHRLHGNAHSLALTLNNLGNVFRALDDIAQAQRHFEECLRVCDQHGIDATRCYALGNLGLVAYRAGGLDLAQMYAGRTLAEPALAPHMRLSAHALQALVDIARGRLKEAAVALRLVAAGARTSGHLDVAMHAITVHAQLLAALGDRAAAAVRLCYVADHPAASALDRIDARRMLGQLALDDVELACARRDATGLATELLLHEAVHARVP